MSAEAPVNPDVTETPAADTPAPLQPISPTKKRGRPAKDQVVGTKKVPGAALIEGPDVKIIHFLTDGHTAAGRLFYYGEEYRVRLGSGEHEAQKDKYGNCWFDLSEDEQLERYGKVIYKDGPWPGVPWDDLEEYMKNVDQNDAEAVKRAEKRMYREQAKRKQVPHTK